MFGSCLATYSCISLSEHSTKVKCAAFFQPLLPSSFLAVIDSLSNLSVRIPEFLQKGETADLTCSYNLGGDTLYSVKWYKGRHEFYRYMPHEAPQIKTFPVKGMKINVSTINHGQTTG